MLSLVLAESALELVPFTLQHHPSVLSHARKLDKDPSDILLDNSWHFAAMKGLENEIKRGRPDLIHFSILEATSIPLYLQNRIKIYIHTIDDNVIYIGENVHIPKSYHRFEGLIEKLFREKIIRSDNNILLEIKKKSLSQLLDEIKPSKIIGFSTMGKLNSFEKITSEISDNTCMIIGGFQKGHFSDFITHKLDRMYSVGTFSYETHVVVARILYEYEKTIFM